MQHNDDKKKEAADEDLNVPRLEVGTLPSNDTMLNWYIHNLQQYLQKDYNALVQALFFDKMTSDGNSFNAPVLTDVVESPSDYFNAEGCWRKKDEIPFFGVQSDNEDGLLRFASAARNNEQHTLFASGANDCDKIFACGLRFTISSDMNNALVNSRPDIMASYDKIKQAYANAVKDRLEACEMAMFIAMSGTKYTDNFSNVSDDLNARLSQIQSLQTKERVELMAIGELGLRLYKAPRQDNQKNQENFQDFLNIIAKHNDRPLHFKLNAIIAEAKNHPNREVAQLAKLIHAKQELTNILENIDLAQHTSPGFFKKSLPAKLQDELKKVNQYLDKGVTSKNLEKCLDKVEELITQYRRTEYDSIMSTSSATNDQPSSDPSPGQKKSQGRS